jgi:putative component of membrane protein insertase Oxa1/YidC/SpoIIIJ protein YidD
MTITSCRRIAGCGVLALGLGGSFAHSQVQDARYSESRETAAFFAAPFSALLSLYRSVIRKARPAVCQMYPSDSSYAVQAIQKHGPAKGILLASDRLQRCGNDLKQYEPVIMDGRPFYSDPVP